MIESGERSMTIQCPSCGQTLPAQFTHCQFCGADVSKVPRPVPAPTQKRRALVAPARWVPIAYYGVAVWYIVGALVTVVQSAVLKDFGPELAYALFKVAIGLGLIFKVELVRGIINILCWIQIAFSGMGLLTAILAGPFIGPMAFLLMLLYIIDICANALMIFLIGETDDFM